MGSCLSGWTNPLAHIVRHRSSASRATAHAAPTSRAVHRRPVLSRCSFHQIHCAVRDLVGVGIAAPAAGVGGPTCPAWSLGYRWP